MSKCLTGAMVLALAAAPAVASAQTAPPAGQKITLSMSMLRGNAGLQRDLLAAAEKMPEADYQFKPTAETRPFGQLVAHIALSQFGGCAALKGEASPKAADKEETQRTKAQYVALMKESSSYCEPVLATITEENILGLIKVRNNEVARGLFLSGANSHANEMYGTMAVYLRLKGLVPPTTERQMEAQKKSGSGGH
jgi:uncharacterized damage-inducible protein DinB